MLSLYDSGCGRALTSCKQADYGKGSMTMLLAPSKTGTFDLAFLFTPTLLRADSYHCGTAIDWGWSVLLYLAQSIRPTVVTYIQTFTFSQLQGLVITRLI